VDVSFIVWLDVAGENLTGVLHKRNQRRRESQSRRKRWRVSASGALEKISGCAGRKTLCVIAISQSVEGETLYAETEPCRERGSEKEQG
jgi:hypothetical protein